MHMKAVQWIIRVAIALVISLVMHFLLQSVGVSLYRDFYTLVLEIELGLLALIGVLFVAGNIKKIEPKDVVGKFFRDTVVRVVCIAMAITLLLWLISGKEPGEQPDDPIPAETETSTPSGAMGENGSENADKPSQGENNYEQPQPSPYCSLVDWESDPFFLNIDKYCGYHVEEGDIPNQILVLIDRCLSDINVRESYSTDELNGEHSQYAIHTAQANELYKGYILLHNENILLDYQLQMLKDELEERRLADELYQVSDNKMIMGDTCIRIGDIYYNEKHDLNNAQEYYKRAFATFQDTYRTCIEEGADDETCQKIIDRLVFASDKITMLGGMDSREQTMAPLVVDAFKRLQEIIYGFSA